ncbi:hydrogenase iron-sulfur subunit [bacterium]|nr:hydrogenase iron-sulfur subunit [bacterium]
MKSKLDIVIFCCHNCIPPEAVSIEKQGKANIKLIKLPCSGKIEVLHILKSFESGVDGVLVAGCMDGKCQSLVGNRRARGRVARAKKYLNEIGLEQDRLKMCQLDPSAEQALAEAANEILEKIQGTENRAQKTEYR